MRFVGSCPPRPADPVWLGRALVFLTGTFIGCAAGIGLGIGVHEQKVCVAVGGSLVLCSLLMTLLPWRRLPDRATLLAPALVLIGLGLIGVLTDTAAQSFLLFLILAVVYLGVTQPPRTATYALPAFVAVFWVAYPTHPASVLVRLPLAILVWVMVGELIAWGAGNARHNIRLLEASSLIDPLTDIGNRRRLAVELAALPVGGLVMFLDLDHFKEYNDRFGHHSGDQLLTHFAKVMQQSLRGTDLVARFGGEEFVIVLHSNADGRTVYERIRANWAVAGGSVNFSAGVAQRHPGESPDATLTRADQALYRAKLNGRNRFEVDETADRLVPPASVPPSENRFDVQDILAHMQTTQHDTPT